MVRAVEDQDGVYIDADGQEYEEPNATEIFRQSQTGGDWKQVQGARTEKRNSQYKPARILAEINTR